MATTFKFDKGPSASWAKRFFESPRAYYVTHPSARFRTEFGPVYYRGRLNGTAKLLIVGQDPSTDEILAQRNLVGASGQRVQKLLNKLGISKSYMMFNTFLFGIKGQMDAAMNAIAVEPTILNYRNSLVPVASPFGGRRHCAAKLEREPQQSGRSRDSGQAVAGESDTVWSGVRRERRL
jgi:hypothetical protein